MSTSTFGQLETLVLQTVRVGDRDESGGGEGFCVLHGVLAGPAAGEKVERRQQGEKENN